MRENKQPEGTLSESDKARIFAGLKLAREEMLETGKRNRLINTPRKKSKSKSLEIVDELSDEVFGILYRDHKVMNFLPDPKRKDGENADGHVYVPPDNDGNDENGKAI